MRGIGTFTKPFLVIEAGNVSGIGMDAVGTVSENASSDAKPPLGGVNAEMEPKFAAAIAGIELSTASVPGVVDG